MLWLIGSVWEVWNYAQGVVEQKEVVPDPTLCPIWLSPFVTLLLPMTVKELP